MVHIPVLGRLSIADYYALCVTFIILIFEIVSFSSKKAKSDDVTDLESLGSTEEFVRHFNYQFEEYVVKTTDGYLLGIHRIPSKNQNKDHNKPVVLLWHGFLMNSEVFVCKPNANSNLAFWLSDLGYDVWLGNARGNKYSHKHLTRSPLSNEFWDFSLDEFAMHDLPNTVDSLTYIGFSQGTAQAFASLSVHHELNKKINLFVCLAPATAPKGLENRVVNACIRATPNVIYLIFGRRAALTATLFWQQLLPRKLFVQIIDRCMLFLFDWHTKNMSNDTKLSCYHHLYSITSVKTLVHWFQIIRANRFQFYDDVPHSILPTNPSSSLYIAHPYPTKQIECPLAIFYGGSDTLTDMGHFFTKLPKPVLSKEIKAYEHLDFLWADDLKLTVLPDLAKVLAKFNPLQ